MSMQSTARARYVYGVLALRLLHTGHHKGIDARSNRRSRVLLRHHSGDDLATIGVHAPHDLVALPEGEVDDGDLFLNGNLDVFARSRHEKRRSDRKRLVSHSPDLVDGLPGRFRVQRSSC